MYVTITALFFFFFYILYRAYWYIYVFCHCVCVGFCILNSSLWMQWIAPMDSEYELQIGSLFPWCTLQTKILHSLLQCLFNIIKNKLLRIQKSALYIWKISLSLYTFPFFFSFLLIGRVPISAFRMAVKFQPVCSSLHHTVPLMRGVGIKGEWEQKKRRGEGKREKSVMEGWLATRWPWERRLRNRWSLEHLHHRHPAHPQRRKWQSPGESCSGSWQRL